MFSQSMETREENSRNLLKAKLEKIKAEFIEIGPITKQLIKDDPRRIIHSFKVGLAIALVSLFYYFDPLYEGFGVNAMWGVLTVVVVFEYSVGTSFYNTIYFFRFSVLFLVCIWYEDLSQ